MQSFYCPYLQVWVELADARQAHIAQAHPDLLPQHLDLIGKVLQDPDQVRSSRRMSEAQVFYRWFTDFHSGKYVAVVVVSESLPAVRHWIITAYITRRVANGDLEWSKS